MRTRDNSNDALIEVRVVLRINTADVHQAACDDESVEVPTGVSNLGLHTLEDCMLFSNIFALSDRCTIGLQSNVLRSVAEAECGPRNGTEQADNAEHHVEVTPGFLDEQVRTKNGLTNDVQDSTACTSHCIRKTERKTKLLLKPTTENASGHQPEQSDLGEADEHTSDVPLPDDRELRHAKVCSSYENTCKRTDDSNVELLKQCTDDWREDNLEQVNKGHVERNVGNLNSELHGDRTICQTRAAEGNSTRCKDTNHASKQNQKMTNCKLLSFYIFSHNPSFFSWSTCALLLPLHAITL